MTLLNEYADGAWLVELAPLSEPERVPSAVASGLAILEDPHRPPAETLAEQLRSRQLLLVVDNCEHVLATCADLLASLLGAAPRLRVLATSREGLGIPGEIVIPVPSLAIPDQATDVSLLPSLSAVRLFVERAQAVRPDFELTPANAEAVAEIVRRLDGIPLAVELAAARVKVLSAQQIASRLSDRLRLLSGGPRTAVPRQQTLRAAMDWSYGLLDDVEQHVFRRLSVFMGSCTLEAVEAICGGDGIEAVDILDLVSRLVDKSSSWLYRDLRIATASWRPSDSMAVSDWRKPARATWPAPRIGTGAPRWWKPLPTRSVEVGSRRAGWSCWNSSTTTSHGTGVVVESR